MRYDYPAVAAATIVIHMSYYLWLVVDQSTQNSVVGGGHHKILCWAPQNSVVGTTKFCGGHHKILWWAPQNSVVVPRQTEFSERKRKQVLSYGEQYLLNGRC